MERDLGIESSQSSEEDDYQNASIFKKVIKRTNQITKHDDDSPTEENRSLNKFALSVFRISSLKSFGNNIRGLPNIESNKIIDDNSQIPDEFKSQDSSKYMIYL